MSKVFFVAGLFFVVPCAMAQTATTQKKPAEKESAVSQQAIDTTKFCYYENRFYTKGAVVKMGSGEMQCQVGYTGRYTQDDPPLEWVKPRQ